MSSENYIIFFDGICGLCNNFVNRLLELDKKHNLKFATLQGQTAKKLLDPKLANELETLVFYDNGKVFTKSTAALKAIIKLRRLYSVCAVFFIFPNFFRDWIYDWVAKNRYQWFGKREVCRLPTPSEKKFFLD